ncbi:hypothetical protein FDP41_012253 [Naegleria fowleri]|uniref:Uncharacterized protein n=1 Tax=Naegleria fowleri TaxID=5763 RepID=A0A6A5C1Q3_NAEFO|nr:uncharacterized protein FDP41_012253 [Naegleria fowleri]KAF0981596.1 hypothetical protein FDP41_012253 [Naegleria fowleri]CAG4715851.1 unnamed protein product [Naegleria fowleri]
MASSEEPVQITSSGGSESGTTPSMTSTTTTSTTNASMMPAPTGIRKLFILIGKYFNLISLLLFIGALGWFVCWPLLSKHVYYSENALSVFFQNPEYNQMDANFGADIYNQLKTLNRSSNDFREQTYRTIENYLHLEKTPFFSELKRHSFEIERNYINKIVPVKGENMYVTIRPGRGNGKESIVLTVPFLKSESLSFALSILKMISRMKWLNHDIILVISDGYDHQWAGEDAFISSAVIPTGRMREAITIDFDSFNFEQIAILTEGVNGELPNLDMVNVVTGLLSEGYYNFGSSVLASFFKADPTTSTDVDSLIKKYSQFKDQLPIAIYLYQKLLFRLNQLLNNAIPRDFIEESVIVMYHWYNQLISIPTGPHGWFRKQLTHALTITNSIVPSSSMNKSLNQTFYLLGRVVEITIRSLNNLIEQLHQSFFLYYLVSSQHYYGFEHYLPNLLMFVGALTIQFIGNYYLEGATEKVLTHSLIFVLTNYFIGILIYLTPVILRDVAIHLPFINSTDTDFTKYWFSIVVALVTIALIASRPISSRLYEFFIGERPGPLSWRNVKSLTVALSTLCVGASMIYSSALCIFLSTFLLTLCTITMTIPESKILRLLQLVAILILCPFNLLVVNVITKNYFFDIPISSQLESLYHITDLPQNLFYIVFCAVMIPTWTVFLLLSVIKSSPMQTATTVKTKVE